MSVSQVTDCTQSLDVRAESSLTVEEQNNYYRQRFQNLKLVVKQLQEELAHYKKRCAGVDTVALMLKNSGQEVLKLRKNCRALETAVANLQHRLSSHGLSSSVNIEETETFVPGASKQTLDNLARENARLRSLLKTAETGKKPSEDMQNFKTSLENLEGENSQLRAQLLGMENLKMEITKQYEDAMDQMKHEYSDKIRNLEQELNKLGQRGRSLSPSSSYIERKQTKHAECQTQLEPDSVVALRRALKDMQQHCHQLDCELENIVIGQKQALDEKSFRPDQNDPKISEKMFAELQKKYNETMIMNQRWQIHSENLTSRLNELEGINQDVDMWKNQLEAKEAEIEQLVRDNDTLRQAASIVEILKQQIQVCTEDFNTERKDREEAVNRAKQLQEENVGLKKEIEMLKRSRSDSHTERTTPPAYRSSVSQGALGQARPKQVTMPPHNLVSSHSQPALYPTSGSPSPSASMSPTPSYVGSSMSGADRSSGYASHASQSTHSMAGHQEPPRAVSPIQTLNVNYPLAPNYNNTGASVSDFSSIPRPRGVSTPKKMSDVPGFSLPPVQNVSHYGMPHQEQGVNLQCPNCDKKFSELQYAELLTHMNTCKD